MEFVISVFFYLPRLMLCYAMKHALKVIGLGPTVSLESSILITLHRDRSE